MSLNTVFTVRNFNSTKFWLKYTTSNYSHKDHHFIYNLMSEWAAGIKNLGKKRKHKQLLPLTNWLIFMWSKVFFLLKPEIGIELLYCSFYCIDELSLKYEERKRQSIFTVPQRIHMGWNNPPSEIPEWLTTSLFPYKALINRLTTTIFDFIKKIRDI